MLNHFKWKLFMLHTVFSWSYLNFKWQSLGKAEVVTSGWRLSKSCAVCADSELGGGIPSCGLLWYIRIWEIERWFGPFGPASSIPDSWIFKGHLVFCKDHAVSVSKHIVQKNEAKLKQKRASNTNYWKLLAKKNLTLIQRGKRFQKRIGASPEGVSESPRYSHPTAGRQVNDYLRLQSALRIYAER